MRGPTWGDWCEPRHREIMAAAWRGDWERVREIREEVAIAADRDRLIDEARD